MLKVKQRTEASALITAENLNEGAAKRCIHSIFKTGICQRKWYRIECSFTKNEPPKSTIFNNKAKCFSKIDLICRKLKRVGGLL